MFLLHLCSYCVLHIVVTIITIVVNSFIFISMNNNNYKLSYNSGSITLILFDCFF